jgi:hypothetical protein
MKEGHMDRKALILFMGFMCLALLMGCAGIKPAPTKISPVKVEVASVERLNAIATKPPFQATDVLVFRVNFNLYNPNNILARVDDLYFEAKVEDGTPEKSIILASSMPANVILPGGEITWSPTEPLLYGGLLGTFITRGVGGADGVKGAIQKRDELWTDLGGDRKKFFIDGNITTSLPDFPELGTVRQQFKTEFTIPKL